MGDIQMGHKEVGLGNGKWVELVQYHDKWRVLVAVAFHI
jgi:hypothetical protein